MPDQQTIDAALRDYFESYEGPTGPVTPAPKRSRRRPRAVLIAAAAAVMLVLVGVGVTQRSGSDAPGSGGEASCMGLLDYDGVRYTLYVQAPADIFPPGPQIGEGTVPRCVDTVDVNADGQTIASADAGKSDPALVLSVQGIDPSLAVLIRQPDIPGGMQSGLYVSPAGERCLKGDTIPPMAECLRNPRASG
jgi:hypothetical protein